MGVSALLEQGGPVLVIILLGSVVALAVFLERMFYLRQRYHFPAETLALLKNVGSNDRRHLLDQLRTVDRPLHDLVLKILEWESLPPAEAIERLSPHMAQVEKRFSRGSDILSTIASISPLLGLLGTVLGMMHVFQTINAQGLGNPNQLAGGISEALLTTIAGLLVAIPTFIGYKVVSARAGQILGKMEHTLSEVFEHVFQSIPQRRS